MALKSRTVKSNEVRVPDIEPGDAVLVERYGPGRLKAVILNPADFEELRESAELLDAVTGSAELASDLAVAVHHRAEAPEGEVLEDAASVRALLDI